MLFANISASATVMGTIISKVMELKMARDMFGHFILTEGKWADDDNGWDMET